MAQPPITRQSGAWACIQRPIPLISAPLPTGTITASIGCWPLAKLQSNRPGSLRDRWLASVFDEPHAALDGKPPSFLFGRIKVGPGKPHFGVQSTHPGHFCRVGRCCCKDDDSLAARASRISEPLAEIAGRGRDQRIVKTALLAQENTKRRAP